MGLDTYLQAVYLLSFPVFRGSARGAEKRKTGYVEDEDWITERNISRRSGAGSPQGCADCWTGSGHRESQFVEPVQGFNRIICASSANMTEIADDTVHLVVTSPPYCVGKVYETHQTFEDWLRPYAPSVRRNPSRPCPRRQGRYQCGGYRTQPVPAYPVLCDTDHAGPCLLDAGGNHMGEREFRRNKHRLGFLVFRKQPDTQRHS